MDGGGWWWMVEKKFSDFAQNFFRCSSDKINLEIFGVLRNNFLMGLKINFKFEILGILVQNPHIQQAFFFKIPIFSRPFFLFKIPIFSRREVPPASLARSVLKPCAPKPCELTYPRLVLHVLC